MDVAHQLQQVGIFLAKNGLVTVLKQVPASRVFQVEADRATREKPPYDVGNWNKPGAEQKMKMIGHQGPRRTAGLAIPQNTAKPLQKIIAIGVVPENIPALDPANDNVMQSSKPI
jgi:hypothetical protein